MGMHSAFADAATRRGIPPFIRFTDGAAEYRRRREKHIASGGDRSPPLPPEVVRLGAAAGLSRSAIGKALGGVEPSTITTLAKKHGFSLIDDRGRSPLYSSVAAAAAAYGKPGAVEETVADEMSLPCPVTGADETFDFSAVLPSLGPGGAVPETAAEAPVEPTTPARAHSVYRTQVIETVVEFAKQFGVLPPKRYVAAETSFVGKTVANHFDEAAIMAAEHLVPPDAYARWLKAICDYRLRNQAGVPSALADAFVAARIPVDHVAALTGQWPEDIEAAYASRGSVPPQGDFPSRCFADRLTDDAVLELACAGITLGTAATLAGVMAVTLQRAVERAGLEWTGSKRLPKRIPAIVEEITPEPEYLDDEEEAAETGPVAAPVSDDPLEALARALAAKAGLKPDAPAWTAFAAKAQRLLDMADEL